MSTNEIELTTTEVSPETSIEIDGSINSAEFQLVEQDSIVEAYKKEYSIVGDGLYASINTEEAPQWLLSIVDSVIDAQLANSLLDLGEARTSILAAIAEVEVAKNQYEELINIEATIDGIITSRLTTLNASVDTNRADIINLDSTKVTEAEALTIAANKITTELNTGAIKAQLDRIDTAHADLDSATTGSINTLTATLTGQNTEIEGAAAVTQELLSYVGIDEDGNSIGTGILADIELLQKQNDGVIETITGTYDVITYQDSNPADGIPDTNTAELITTVEPYASWIAAEEAGSTDVRLGHIGDVYIKYSENTNGTREYIASYKFIRTAVDTVTPLGTDSEGFTWALIIDQAAQDAYTQALSAYDLADNKRRVFVIEPTGPYDVGDLWSRNIDDSDQLWIASIARDTGFLLSEWYLVSTDDKAVTTLQTGLEDGTVEVDLSSATVDGNQSIQEYVSGQIDDIINVFSGTDVNAQTGMQQDDIFIEKTTETGTSGITVDVVNTYRYNGTSWDKIGNNDNLTGLADLADGKRTIFAGSTIPTGAVERDLWIPEAGVNEPYVAGEVYQFLSNIWTLATKYTEDLNNFVDVVNTTVASLRNQIDSQIVYYIFDNVVDANNDGYVGADESTVLDSIKAIYTTAELKEAATGNITYFKDTTNGYWYQNSTDSWLAINDTSIMQALREAEEAKDIANNKITLYSAYKQTTAPAVTELWLDSSGTLTLKEYTTSWTTVQTNTGDLVYLENPDEDEGDYAETPYRWNGSSWVINRDGAVVANAQAITDLGIELDNGTNTWADADSQLQQTINGKIEGDIATVESKFEYNSNINVNGSYYTSGFGLVTNYTSGTGTEADPYNSEFWINAEKFKFTNSNQTGYVAPFTIDASGTQPQITFNGLVTFGSGQTGTVSEAVSAIIETTVVGDKNINITDNLIPTDSLVSDIEHAGYQFIGDPIKSMAAGADTFVEPQILLDANDEVYSPYVDDMTMPYYFRYAFKGNHTGMVVELSGPEGSMTATNVPITYTLVPGQTIDANTWYIIDGLIHPTGGTNHISGSIKRASDKYKIADVNDIVLNSATVWMTLGWLGATTISRMKLAIVTADTITTDFIDAEYVQDALDTIDLSGYIQSSEINQVLADDTTIIDGSRIVTGTIDGALANITNINASSITSGVIYNTGGSASSYNMKIDLDAGEIHIR